jgi:predicted RNase H-like nuclease (RuvC/YqgF family)
MCDRDDGSRDQFWADSENWDALMFVTEQALGSEAASEAAPEVATKEPEAATKAATKEPEAATKAATKEPEAATKAATKEPEAPKAAAGKKAKQTRAEICRKHRLNKKRRTEDLEAENERLRAENERLKAFEDMNKVLEAQVRAMGAENQRLQADITELTDRNVQLVQLTVRTLTTSRLLEIEQGAAAVPAGGRA